MENIIDKRDKERITNPEHSLFTVFTIKTSKFKRQGQRPLSHCNGSVNSNQQSKHKLKNVYLNPFSFELGGPFFVFIKACKAISIEGKIFFTEQV